MTVIVAATFGGRGIYRDEQQIGCEVSNGAGVVGDLEVASRFQSLFDSGFRGAKRFLPDLPDVLRILVDPEHVIAHPLQVQGQAQTDSPDPDDGNSFQRITHLPKLSGLPRDWCPRPLRKTLHLATPRQRSPSSE